MATAWKELDDVIECPICTEVLTDPRVLPCVHTYCLKCPQTWAKDKQTGDDLACPLCGKECAMPDDGLKGLTKNFFVEKLLRIRELTRAETSPAIPCDVCAYEAADGKANVPPATAYCLECQENLCKSCASVHKNQKVSRDHKVMQLVKPEDLFAQYPPARCDKHSDEARKMYCFDCKSALCMLCHISGHNSHKCSDISEVVSGFREQLTSDVDSVAAGLTTYREMMKTLAAEKDQFSKKVSKAESEIRAKTKQLKEMIDRHEKGLLEELSSMSQKRTKEIEAINENIEHHLAATESYMKYVKELQEKGTACDIVRAVNGLHDRAGDLLMVYAIQRTLADIGTAER